MLKNSVHKKTRSIKQPNNLKDHTENDFEGIDKLITTLGGRRIELDKSQQKEVLEFIYAIGICGKDMGDLVKNTNIEPDVKLRATLLIWMKNVIYSASAENVRGMASELVSGMLTKVKMTIN